MALAMVLHFLHWYVVTHFALVLHLNCTALSQSDASMHITSSETHLDGITHDQTIICRQLSEGYVVGSWPMKRKKKHRMLMTDIQYTYFAKKYRYIHQICIGQL